LNKTWYYPIGTWAGILVEQYQDLSSSSEVELPGHQIIGSPIYGTRSFNPEG